MLSAAQVAAQLGISARKVYDLAARGELVSYRFGDAVRFEPSDVEAYKASCKVVVQRVVASQPRAVRLRSWPDDDGLEQAFLRLGVTPRLVRPGRKKAVRG